MATQYTLKLPESDARDAAQARDRIRELAFACRDIMADGVITPQELEALRYWTAHAAGLWRYWPANAILARLKLAIEAGADANHAELGKLLKEIAAGLSMEEDSSREEIFANPVPRIRIEGRTFVFTGIFYYGTRAQCENAVLERGGEVRKSVARSTDYVVVGGVASPQWLYAERGTKIEDALLHQRMEREEAAARRSKRKPDPAPMIIRERDWVNKITGGPLPGFAFCVPGVFEDAVLTNDLHAGDTFYDSIEGYGVWSQALQKINARVQILDASSGATGKVRFTISRPNEDRTRLLCCEDHTATQAEVISLLKTGIVPTYHLGTLAQLVAESSTEPLIQPDLLSGRATDELPI